VGIGVHLINGGKVSTIHNGYGVFLLLDTGTVRSVKQNCVFGASTI
jgi:hypothetical protein